MYSSRVLGTAAKRVQYHKLPVLPFLYDTATLRRFYSDNGSEFGESYDGSSLGSSSAPPLRKKRTRPSLRERRERPLPTGREGGREESKDWERPRFQDRAESQSYPRKQYADRDSGLESNSYPRKQYLDRETGLESNSYPRKQYPDRDAGPSPWSSRPKRVFSKPDVEEEHVPFEDAKVAAKVEPAREEKTTLSGEERKAFERLRKLALPKPPSAEPEATKLSKTVEQSEELPDALDEVLKEAMANIKNQDSSFKRDMAVSEMRDKEIKRIVELFKTSRTDVQLWSILDKEVLEPIAALNLDNQNDDGVADRGNGKAKSTTVSEKVEPKDREVVMKNFPFLLSSACRSLRGLFPTSPLILAIIPTIRNMGPSVYALGASTKIYNQNIGFVFDNLSDIDRINDILQEMETEVIEPDAITLKMLDQVMMTWQKIRRGLYGEAARVTWETDRFRRSLAALAKSRSQIEANINRQETSMATRRQKRAKMFERD